MDSTDERRGVVTNRRMAILGGGPVGLSALARACADGWDARLYERGRVGENVRAWGHVRMFSPASMNALGGAAGGEGEGGGERGGGDALPSGAEYVAGTLEPLAARPDLAPHVLTGTRVVAISRDALRKGDAIGTPERGTRAFRILLEGPDGERVEEADVVLDATGTFATPNWLGRGGMPALGERALGESVVHRLPDLAGRERARFAGRRTVVVGAGHSAATAIGWLDDLAIRAPGTTAVWITRSRSSRPVVEVPGDPLPERVRVSARANRLAQSGAPWLERVGDAAVLRTEPDGDGVRVVIAGAGETREIRADRLLALVGYRPDLEILRELQVQTCWATEGTYPLAAALLALDGAAAADCLVTGDLGAGTLHHPESGFYTVGAKSYGRNPNFLIRAGVRQVDDVFRAVAGRAA